MALPSSFKYSTIFRLRPSKEVALSLEPLVVIPELFERAKVKSRIPAIFEVSELFLGFDIAVTVTT